MARLRDAGAAVLNQAVLLRGVNDSVDALADLSERGFAAGVLPYYLHQLDRVDGAAHFEVPDARALELHAALVARLSGYLVPKLVRAVDGDASKRALSRPRCRLGRAQHGRNARILKNADQALRLWIYDGRGGDADASRPVKATSAQQ